MHMLYFDGASRGNPGPASYGCVIYRYGLVNDKLGPEIATVKGYIGRTTNNVAEYSALLAGLRECLKLGIKKLEVRGDSLLVIKQVEGSWKVRNKCLAEFHGEVTRLIPNFAYIRFSHVKRENNRRADALANQALDGLGRV